jgi:multicomponent Na+:H+ antiporter subunit D
MFTTKVAVYALARGFPGTEILVPVGTIMALFPIFYAVIENDLRRVLGYSMINQIGFMVVGVGIGTELALNGTVAHAFNEVLFKGLLFMTMGAVLLRVGHVLGSDLGGLYRAMPFTALFCVVGAASISAFPLFNGFVSKSMIMAAMIEQGHTIGWLGLLFASAGVFHHAGIKIPYFAFFGHDSGLQVAEAPRNMLFAMGIAAALCILTGTFPALLYSLLPWEVDYLPYTYPHVLVQVQLLFYSALAFAWLNLVGVYPPELRSVNLDADWLYRRLGLRLSLAATEAMDAASRVAVQPLRDHGRRLRQVLSPGSLLARSAETGTAALLVGAMLAGYLLIYYVTA